MMITNLARDVQREDRQQIWKDYTGPKPDTIRHNFCDYDRYYEAFLIVGALQKRGVIFKKLEVLDFGCCAGDYGMVFSRLGANVDFVDIDPLARQFVEYRQKLEGKKAFVNSVKPVGLYDLTIYGEVLEHCDDALELLTQDVQKEVPYIFTSSYPYRSDDPEDSYWKGRGHSQQARIDQPKCRILLQENYIKINFDGQRNLWIKKGQ